MIKLLMASGIQRNEAVIYASVCSGEMPHNLMGFLVETQPQVRELIQAAIPEIEAGAVLRVQLVPS